MDADTETAHQKPELEKNNEKPLTKRLLLLSKPKKDFYVPPKPVFTKYSKPGPIDWEDFLIWAKVNAKPKKYPEPPPPPERKSVPLSKLESKLEELSTPMHRREKYVKPPEPEYNFRPKINNPSEKKEKPRKLPPEEKKRFCPILPKELPSFPMFPSALTYTPTENILKLAEPKQYPEQTSIPRQKMNVEKWISHLWRLKELSAPKQVRPPPPEEKPLPRKKVPLKKLEKRLQTLAQPKHKSKEKLRDISKVKPAALKAKSTPRIEELAKPPKPRKKYNETSKKYGFVKKSALKYKPTERISTLAKPKEYPEHSSDEDVDKKKEELKKKYEKYDKWSL